jgi:hypothetical protein
MAKEKWAGSADNTTALAFLPKKGKGVAAVLVELLAEQEVHESALLGGE